jgi:hypothetical protein
MCCSLNWDYHDNIWSILIKTVFIFIVNLLYTLWEEVSLPNSQIQEQGAKSLSYLNYIRVQSLCCRINCREGNKFLSYFTTEMCFTIVWLSYYTTTLLSRCSSQLLRSLIQGRGKGISLVTAIFTPTVTTTHPLSKSHRLINLGCNVEAKHHHTRLADICSNARAKGNRKENVWKSTQSVFLNMMQNRNRRRSLIEARVEVGPKNYYLIYYT